MAAHLSSLEDDFWIFLTRPSILEDEMSHELCLFLAIIL